MTTAAPATPTYVRGATPSALGRPLRTSLVAAGLATIVTFAAVLAVQTHQENARLDRLASVGVPVLARVTGCVALASGTGVTGAGATCHAAFTLDGHRHVAVLHANTMFRRPGDMVSAVTTRSNPSDLTVGTPKRGSPTGYAAPAVLTLLLVLTLGWRTIRQSRAQPREPVARRAPPG